MPVIIATGGYDHTIRFWDTSAACYRTIQHADSQVNRLEISPDRQFLAAAGNPHIRLFEVHTSNAAPITSYDGHTGNVTAVGFQKDGRWMFSGSEDTTIKIWDIRAPGCQREYHSSAPINSVVLHPNQAELISGDQLGNVRVWDLAANACSREIVPDGETAVRSVSVSSDASFAAAANNKGHVYVWRLGEEDTSKFEPFQKIEAHKTYVLKCLFSPDVRLLATTSADHSIKLWRYEAGGKDGGPGEFRLEKTLSGHQRWVWDCVFSADSAYLFSASSDNVLKLWDVGMGETIRNFTGHHKAVSAVALAD